ncbi:MAG: hypothetical protein K8S16_19960 [Bacteroidales bacterium]|nr:hypothetical protein [Bacteroidales bacterium]
MKKFTLFLVAICFAMSINSLVAQNISISDVTHAPDASAVLDVYSTSLGMLVPRMATAPSTPATGLLYYDNGTGIDVFKYYDGISWLTLSTGQLWSRSGTDTYLSNTGDNVVIGTNTSAPGYKLYVYGATSQMSRFDGQVEFWNLAGGSMYADINTSSGTNGVVSVYASGSKKIQLDAAGNSFFNGGNVGIGTIPLAPLHIQSPTFPQLFIENPSTSGDASERFSIATIRDYTVGIFYDNSGTSFDHNFKICNTTTLTGPGYTDPNTMMEIHDENLLPGIIDFNHQSRARAYLSTAQTIPSSTWQPIDFNMTNYDEHNEWILVGGVPPNPPSYFTATEEGYYQVNSRTEFRLVDEESPYNIWWVANNAYVSIAIYKGTSGANPTWSMYSQGNNLQIGNSNNNPGEGIALWHNNAPNVSDVVYLQAGQKIAIYTWQSAGMNVDLVPGSAKTYASIHKSS